MNPPLIVVYDACVLYSAFLRDFLVRLAIRGRREGELRARWTGRIHREWIRAVRRQYPSIDAQQLERTRRLMDRNVKGCRVRGYRRWEQRLPLPDPNDRHVLAAALACVADAIVTYNLSDFPPSILGPFGLSAMPPDDFATQSCSSGIVIAAAAEHRAAYRRPALSTGDYLDALRRNRMSATAALLAAEPPGRW